MQALRVQHLSGYGLEVPDVAVAETFYGAFGLTALRLGGALELRSAGTGPADIVVVPGAKKRLHHLSFAIRAQDMEPFIERLKQAGTPVTEPPFGTSLRDGLWFQDPWGTWINLVPTEPLQASKEPVVVEPRVDRHLWRELRRDIRPNRIGHMLIFTPDWAKAEKYFEDVLGLRVTDRAAGKVSFMAGGAGLRDHHCFGLINGTHRGMQHASFQVDTFDDIGFGALQMSKAGFTEGFGVGRHALASNLFHYTRDPWGSWVEYYADMDQISEAWQAKDWQELPYIWPTWAPEFWANEMNANHEAA